MDGLAGLGSLEHDFEAFLEYFCLKTSPSLIKCRQKIRELLVSLHAVENEASFTSFYDTLGKGVRFAVPEVARCQEIVHQQLQIHFDSIQRDLASGICGSNRNPAVTVLDLRMKFSSFEEGKIINLAKEVDFQNFLTNLVPQCALEKVGASVVMVASDFNHVYLWLTLMVAAAGFVAHELSLPVSETGLPISLSKWILRISTTVSGTGAPGEALRIAGKTQTELECVGSIIKQIEVFERIRDQKIGEEADCLSLDVQAKAVGEVLCLATKKDFESQGRSYVTTASNYLSLRQKFSQASLELGDRAYWKAVLERGGDETDRKLRLSHNRGFPLVVESMLNSSAMDFIHLVRKKTPRTVTDEWKVGENITPEEQEAVLGLFANEIHRAMQARKAVPPTKGMLTAKLFVFHARGAFLQIVGLNYAIEPGAGLIDKELTLFNKGEHDKRVSEIMKKAVSSTITSQTDWKAELQACLQKEGHFAQTLASIRKERG
mmetsp:Transcript_31457/g.62170  ORF Transcript_31457/g.62170 Transcript_31457/m.62170 type:complete len:490 (-) Transcript_31457:65-1534(-)